MLLTRITRRLHNWASHAEDAIVTTQRRRAVSAKLRAFRVPYKLHLGCGTKKLSGWVNVDQYRTPDIVDMQWDITKPFPLPAESCELIYHEHVLEHLTVEQARLFLVECRRLLKKGGVMRVAMPSLQAVVRSYCSDSWKDQGWLKCSEFEHIETAAEMLNIAMRSWGHQWLYDSIELERRLYEAGFIRVIEAPWGKSQVPELNQLESRPNSLLIREAQA